MDLGGFASSVLGVAGIGQEALGFAGQIGATAFNARQAAIQRDFQERMAGSSIQRRVQDAMAAGINPIFAVSGGSGAAVPSGASAIGGDPVASANAARLNAAATKRAVVEADTAVQDNTVAHLNAENWLKSQDAMYSARAAKFSADIAESNARRSDADLETRLNLLPGEEARRLTDRWSGTSAQAGGAVRQFIPFTSAASASRGAGLQYRVEPSGGGNVWINPNASGGPRYEY